MKHYSSSHFWRCFNELPQDIQQLARRNYALLKQDPSYKSLHFKAVSNGRYRSVRIGINYRAIGIPIPDGVQWFWIGNHKNYDKLLAL